MNTEHFDGIIEAAGTRIGSEKYGVLAETFGIVPEANARRLAAAWNLCQGIDTDTLEALGVCGLQLALGTPPSMPGKTIPKAARSGD